jgi:hypothetical protein
MKYILGTGICYWLANPYLYEMKKILAYTLLTFGLGIAFTACKTNNEAKPDANFDVIAESFGDLQISSARF